MVSPICSSNSSKVTVKQCLVAKWHLPAMPLIALSTTRSQVHMKDLLMRPQCQSLKTQHGTVDILEAQF
uniref:Uncharacterized protein n=1 Tax=Anguilla anguilla TaxID=7936 RepID=A0A0E9X5Y0_ANGAN